MSASAHEEALGDAAGRVSSHLRGVGIRCDLGTTSPQGALLSAAKALNAVGLRAFPVSADGLPVVRGYHGDRPYAEQELERMPWSKAASLGIAEQPGVISLDVDHKDGAKDGHAHLRALEEAYGPLPVTRRYTSPTGGVHLRYRLPEGIQERSLRKCLLLPDGTDAHIDVLRPGHRFHRVWDMEQWLERAGEIPELPKAWLPALLRVSPPRWAAVAAVADQGAMRRGEAGVHDLIERVAQAPEGQRNDTLNAAYFAACVQGHTDAVTREAFAQAAAQAGLPEEEAEATLDSAREAAWRKWRPVEGWLDSVETVTAQSGKAARWALVVAEQLARLHMELPDPWINMSARRMGEAIGASRTIAARALKQLQDWGLVQRRKGDALGKSLAYRLRLNRHFVDMYPFPHTRDGHMSTNVQFGLACREGLELRHLRGHVAFSRVGPGPVLTPTCAEVLLALRAGPSTRTSLAGLLGRSPGAVRRAVWVLHSAGLVEDRGRAGVELTSFGDVVSALDGWAEAMGVAGRVEWQRWQHAEERLAFYRQHRLIPAEPLPEADPDDQGPPS